VSHGIDNIHALQHDFAGEKSVMKAVLDKKSLQKLLADLRRISPTDGNVPECRETQKQENEKEKTSIYESRPDSKKWK